jgi:hypothetical protein
MDNELTPETPSETLQDAPRSDLEGSIDTSKVVIKKQGRVAEFIFKTLAIFLISAISAIGVGALIGVDAWKTIVIAGVIGLLRVLENIARGYIDDGQLTIGEIDNAFKTVDEQSDENI